MIFPSQFGSRFSFLDSSSDDTQKLARGGISPRHFIYVPVSPGAGQTLDRIYQALELYLTQRLALGHGCGYWSNILGIIVRGGRKDFFPGDVFCWP